jgi:acyl carrier protein
MSCAEITADSHLLLDVGLTSLKFVDLTLSLEKAFGFDEFPIQEWIDLEQSLGDRGFRVQALVDACVQLFESGMLVAQAVRG